MNKNVEILKARSYYYEFFATPLFFYENDERFKIWQTQLEQLSQNPLNEASQHAFEALKKFDFTTFADEQNSVLFDLSYINVPLTASFYEEGRDEGAARLRVIEILKKSPYRRDTSNCLNSEDFVGFIFLLMSTFLADECEPSNELDLSSELFERLINGFADEFAYMLKTHKCAKFFESFAIILQSFISLERSILAVQAPEKNTNEKSVAEVAMERKPYQTKMPTVKSKMNWDEFTAL
ncbi:TorD/DmsD family molecular chaperone [Campylobacter suis]|uniref:Formate dehydrogenase-specific chaperone n=1 Tax=Campylobacter suis TaxID=2790657 RepID=A0ABM8Q8S6_9BACT|nr:formate dehydrogenase-specific chaperone [Campylobacter suis]CAD7289225.1 hypothetical protein LMG8286_01701 [Campylobacter suis]